MYCALRVFLWAPSVNSKLKINYMAFAFAVASGLGLLSFGNTQPGAEWDEPHRQKKIEEQPSRSMDIGFPLDRLQVDTAVHKKHLTLNESAYQRRKNLLNTESTNPAVRKQAAMASVYYNHRKRARQPGGKLRTR